MGVVRPLATDAFSPKGSVKMEGLGRKMAGAVYAPVALSWQWCEEWVGGDLIVWETCYTPHINDEWEEKY